MRERERLKKKLKFLFNPFSKMNTISGVHSPEQPHHRNVGGSPAHTIVTECFTALGILVMGVIC